MSDEIIQVGMFKCSYCGKLHDTHSSAELCVEKHMDLLREFATYDGIYHTGYADNYGSIDTYYKPICINFKKNVLEYVYLSTEANTVSTGEWDIYKNSTNCSNLDLTIRLGIRHTLRDVPPALNFKITEDDSDRRYVQLKKLIANIRTNYEDQLKLLERF